ncbi:MAG: hypothetical protein ABIQ60_05030 [Burkholderiaceae bacterium]
MKAATVQLDPEYEVTFARPAKIIVAARRRLVASVLVLPAMAIALSLGAPLQARAAVVTLPPALVELDAAAMRLFDAAEAGDWSAAQTALARVKTAAAAVPAIESVYLDAGGELRLFFQARNNLSSDLPEADLALSVKDQRWLISVADRIAARAGEISAPMVGAGGALAPRIETLLSLTRSMRRALVWRDNFGFRSAQDDFKRLWKTLRDDAGLRAPEKSRQLDALLDRIETTGTSTDMSALDAAIRDLRKALG